MKNQSAKVAKLPVWCTQSYVSAKLDELTGRIGTDFKKIEAHVLAERIALEDERFDMIDDLKIVHALIEVWKSK